MHLRFQFSIATLAILTAMTAFGQGAPSDFPNYGFGSLPLASTPGTQGGAAGAYWNPSVWAAMPAWEASFSWNDHNIIEHHMDDWGLYLGGHGLGFAMKRNSLLPPNSLQRTSYVEDYQMAFAGGDQEWNWGMAYGWSKGRADWVNHDQFLSWGSMYRPMRYLSAGGVAYYSLDNGDYRGIVDLGIRPLGTDQVAAFADAAAGQWDNPSTMQWGAGVEVMPLNGLRVAFKMSKPYAFTEDKILTLSFGLALDDLGFQVVPHYDKKFKRQSSSYLFRMSRLVPDFSTHAIFNRKGDVVTMPMKGNLTYQKARFFDRGKIALYETEQTIDDAMRDPSVGGIALNISGLNAQRELLWELRQKLVAFKQSGKKIYIYLDNVGMGEYYFASVADYLWIDPQGMIGLPGYVAGRTYMKGTLEKLGLGVEEWRFFKYKSAFESLARKDMSEADKEQRLTLIQDFYDDWQKTVAEARNIAPEKLRGAIDSIGIFTPEEALAFGLVDSIGTWDDTPDFVEHVVGKRPDLIGRQRIEAYTSVDNEWGPAPEIALVYAVGESDMDAGFKGRMTSRVLRKLGREENVKAIVLRADSPGGDALAADLIARQVKETAVEKPVIVSQGAVAASGGYWISMYGKPIYASPYTITGSIGVIGGWIWNNGFGSFTGLYSDHVKVGQHADLGFGITLPFIGAQIPDRNLDSLEHGRMERVIRGLYTDFTKQVATGRKLDQAYVDSIGQGRVWSGTRGKDVKLVDKIGGLEDALADAREQTKLTGRRHVVINEYPQPSLFGFDGGMNPMSPIALLSHIFSPDATSAIVPDAWKESYEWRVLHRMSLSPGKPLLMVPPEDIPPEN